MQWLRAETKTHPSKHGRELLRARDVAGPQVVLDALAVEVPICRVQLAGRVHHVGCLERVASVLRVRAALARHLEDLGLDHVEINERRRVCNGGVNEAKGLRGVAVEVLVLGQDEVCPQQRRGRLHLRGCRVSAYKAKGDRRQQTCCRTAVMPDSPLAHGRLPASGCKTYGRLATFSGLE
jgi:hypothetical protein